MSRNVVFGDGGPYPSDSIFERVMDLPWVKDNQRLQEFIPKFYEIQKKYYANYDPDSPRGKKDLILFLMKHGREF